MPSLYNQLYRTDGTRVREEYFTRIGNQNNGYIPVVFEEKLGLLDTKGNYVAEPCIAVGETDHLLLSENKIVINDNNRIGIVEVKGTDNMQVAFVSDFKTDPGTLTPFAEGLAAVYHRGKQGFVYVDQQGKLLPDVYDMAYPFKEGKGLVMKKPEQWFYIDQTAETVKEGERPKDTAATQIYPDTGELRGIKQGEKQLTDPIFTWITSVNDDLNFAILAQGEHKNVMIDPFGNIKVTLPDQCVGAQKQGNNLILNYDEGCQLADLKGNVLNQTYFAFIGNFDNGLAPFTLDGKVGLIAQDGKIKTEATLAMDNIRPAYGNGKIIGTLHEKLLVITVTQ